MRNFIEYEFENFTEYLSIDLFIYLYMVFNFSTPIVFKKLPLVNYRWRNYGWHRTCKFPKFVLPAALKLHSLALLDPRFLCKAFSKLLKFTLRINVLRVWFLRNSYIHRKYLYGYKIVKAANGYDLKMCSK